MSEGITLERLRVVVEGTTKPFQDEMRKLRAVTAAENKKHKEMMDKIRKPLEDFMKPFRKIREEMEKVNSIKPMNMAGMSAQQKQLQKDITATERQLGKLIERRNELEDTGGDIEYTAEFKEMIKAVEQAERKLNSLIEKKERLKATGGLKGSSAKSIDYDIGQAENTLKYAKADVDNSPTGERYQNTEKWRSLNREIERCRVSLAQYHAKEQEVGRGAGRIRRIVNAFASMRTTLKQTKTGIQKTSGAFAALIQRFKNGIPFLNKTKKSMNDLGGCGKGLGGMFRTIGMTAKFMFASFLIQGVLAQAKAGLQNLAKYSNEYGTQFNKSVTMMYSALKQLQNALATAFAPIINVAAPYITTLIKHLTAGANALAQFFSALTGSKTWTKASYNSQNYADSVDNAAGSVKKLKNELYGFDEITKQQGNDTSGGGSGGGGGLSPGDMFTEEAVNNQFADFAKMVTDAWKKADFTEIGEIVGNKLNAALSSIDWTKIQATTKKIAKSVATFLNGFIKATDWKLVGKTIANGINTAVMGARTFLTTFNWKALGESIATGINSFFETFDFIGLAETLNRWVDGLEEAIGTAVKTLKWGTILGGIKDFLTNLEFDTVAAIIGTLVIKKIGVVTIGSAIKNWVAGKIGAFLSGLTISGLKISIPSFALAFQGTPGFDVVADWILSGIDSALSDLLPDWFTEFWGEFLVGFSAVGAFSGGNPLAAVFGGLFTSFPIDIDWGEITSFEWALGWFDEAKKAFATAFDGKRKDILDIGGWILEGILDGFVGALSFIVEPIARFFTAIYDGLCKKLKIHSPAKTMYPIGKNILLGIVVGFKETFGKAIAAAGEFGKKFISGFKKTIIKWWGDVKLSVKNTFDTVSKNVSEWYGNVKKWWGSKTLSIKNKFDTLLSNVSGWYSSVKNWWGKKTLSIKNSFDTISSNVSGWYGNVKNWWGTKTLSIKNKLDTFSGDVSGWFNKIQGWWGTKTLSVGATTSSTGASLYEIVKGSWNTAAQTALSAKAVIDTVCNVSKVIVGPGGRSISAYATGGLPPKGQLFVANEAGPEMVGSIDGKTAVANSNQIVTAVSSGVSSAVYGATVAALSQFSGGGNSTPEIHVYVGGKEVTDYVVEDVNKRTLATGRCPILT